MLNSAMLFLAEFGGQEIVIIVLVVALVLMLVVMPMFTNKKRQQAVNMLHSSLKVGDRIMTIGGIIGVVREINQTSPVDKELVIETGAGSNKTTMTVDIKALYQVLPPQVGSPVFETAAQNSRVAQANPVEKKVEEFVVEEPTVEEPVVEENSVEENPVESETVATEQEEEKKEQTTTKKTSTKKPITKK